jgi:hypothetical protein
LIASARQAGLTGYTGFFHFPDEDGKVLSTCGGKIHSEYFI